MRDLKTQKKYKHCVKIMNARFGQRISLKKAPATFMRLNDCKGYKL